MFHFDVGGYGSNAQRTDCCHHESTGQLSVHVTSLKWFYNLLPNTVAHIAV